MVNVAVIFSYHLSLANTVGVRNVWKFKLVSAVSHIDVRGHIVCALYVMNVSVRNLQKSVIPCKLSMGKLVGMMSHVDARKYIVCTLHAMYVSVGNFH